MYRQAVQILSEKLDRCDETQDLRSGLMSLDQPQSELGGWRTRLTDIYSVLEKLRPFFIPGAKLIHPPERFRRVVAHGWCRNAGTKRPRVWDEDEFPERGRGEIRDQRSGGETRRGRSGQSPPLKKGPRKDWDWGSEAAKVETSSAKIGFFRICILQARHGSTSQFE